MGARNKVPCWFFPPLGGRRSENPDDPISVRFKPFTKTVWAIFKDGGKENDSHCRHHYICTISNSNYSDLIWIFWWEKKWRDQAPVFDLLVDIIFYLIDSRRITSLSKTKNYLSIIEELRVAIDYDQPCAYGFYWSSRSGKIDSYSSFFLTKNCTTLFNHQS